jgi:hypothetical protein
MNRPILAFALFAIAAATLSAQDASQSSPYQGTSNPPADDTITIISDTPAPAPKAKPRAGHPVTQAAPAQQPDDSQVYDQPQPASATNSQPTPQPAPQPAPVPTRAAAPTAQTYADGTDDGIVQPGSASGTAPADRPAPTATRAPETLGYREDNTAQPNQRGPEEPGYRAESMPQQVPADDSSASSRHDSAEGDYGIVNPEPLPPGTIGEGTLIRVHLMEELSSGSSEKGQPFRSQVATDVLQDGQVVIPAGAEIDGVVTDVSTGRFGGHGSLRLRPETVILENGSRFKLHAYVAGAPGTGTRVGSEGNITPGSRVEREGIIYGGAVGGGAIAGAMIGGPAGALVGTIVGAGVATTHLLVSHPQTTLERGTTLILTVSHSMSMVPAGTPGS